MFTYIPILMGLAGLIIYAYQYWGPDDGKHWHRNRKKK